MVLIAAAPLTPQMQNGLEKDWSPCELETGLNAQSESGDRIVCSDAIF